MNINPNIISRNPEGLYDGDLRILQRYDIQDDVIYVGRAHTATATSSAAWTIKRTTLVDGNPTVTQWSSATAIWDNRVTETYS